MLYTIQNDALAYSLNEKGLVVSIVNRKSGHELCAAPGEIFRLIYQIGDYEERSVQAIEQDPPEITVEGEQMTVNYPYLKKENEVLAIRLTYRFRLQANALLMTATIENDSDVMIAELQSTPFAGFASLSGEPKEDILLVPRRLGHRIPDPCHADFFRHSIQFKKKYERPDYIHSDLDVPYPGFSSMQWFSIYNDKQSIYIGNHDAQHRILCHHIERRVADNTLRFGTAQYPFLNRGEAYEVPMLVFALCEGDWHSGAKIYRKWMEEECGWKAPVDRPEWARNFQGWLRVIFRTQSGEYNYHFSDIPRMFDEVQEAGLNTLFLLGWPEKGFGHYRGDYLVDENELEDLKKGIDYVHSKGGKLLMFVSYHAVDRKSNYYKYENGEQVLMRDLWGDHIRFSETYARDATYRKILNNPHSQYCTCSGSDKWHEKMKQTANYCLELGADGVLYDLGGTKPLFCFAEGHDHKKSNEGRASKARRYRELRANIKRYGTERIILQEHCIDIYAQHMDLVQPPNFGVHDMSAPEMFLYTFPEIKMTNRNMALDEENMQENVAYSFLYNLAYDMSIFRCCGILSDIPNYTKLVKEAVALKTRYADYMADGIFIDEDGFDKDAYFFRQKAYRTRDGRLGLAVWNDSDTRHSVTYTNIETKKSVCVTLEKMGYTFVEL